MPLPAIGLIASSGFQLVKKAKLGQRAGQALKKGFGFLRDKAKQAKFTATEKGFRLTAPGISAQGGQSAQGAGTQASYMAGATNYLPYFIGGALLLMLIKK